MYTGAWSKDGLRSLYKGRRKLLKFLNLRLSEDML